jgi:hypothetical protein
MFVVLCCVQKAVRVLQESLHRLFENTTPVNMGSIGEEVSLEMTSVDMDFRRKKKQVSLPVSQPSSTTFFSIFFIIFTYIPFLHICYNLLDLAH